jgi:hypothetical protein
MIYCFISFRVAAAAAATAAAAAGDVFHRSVGFGDNTDVSIHSMLVLARCVAS